MYDLLWGLLDGWLAYFVALADAILGTEWEFFDEERGGGVWYRLGFLFGAASLLGGSFRGYRGRRNRD